MKIRFIRFNKNVKIPQRKYHSDTGADIFMVEGGQIYPGETKVIPLGFGVEIPNGHTARIQVRTSIAKQGVMIQGCAIDAGYVGEISMILHNINIQKGVDGRDIGPWEWNAGDRLGYIEVYPTQYPEFVEDLPETRGTGAFGSTGK